jgi:PAS domain S-box-containing protein
MQAGSTFEGEAIETELNRLRTHDHLCLIYDGREEQLRAVVPFLRAGLEVRERCLYVADGRAVAELAPALVAGGIDVEAELGRGALALATERETYLARGDFDPDAMLTMAEAAAAQAVSEGYGGLRILGEMSWALGDGAKLQRLMEYEVKVNDRIARTPAVAVCQYDRRRFSPEIIRDVIRTHPLVAIGGRVCRNFYYVPPAELIAPDRSLREVDRLLQNIHDRERAEDLLRESERRLARVLEGSRDAFWDWDLKNDEVVYSARWGDLTGAPLRGSIADWRRGVHPDDAGQAWAALAEHLEGRSDAYLAEYRFRAGGGWRWLQARGRIVASDAKGRPLRMAGTATDVTDRRSLQARLEMAGRLAAVGTLAAGVAHEINNPLAYVSANLRFVHEQLGAAPPATPDAGALAAAVADALDGAERVGEVVRGLRRFAGPAAETSRGPVDVGAEIEAAAGIARHEVVPRARLVVDVPAGLPPVVAGPHELGQVVVNLLVNAAHAIPEGRAGDHEVRVTARAADRTVVVEVSDTGVGIPSDVLPRIFDPFFTTKQVGTGAGLGLAICHGIVAGAGGAIHVRSEPGRGSTFRVELPAAEGGAPAPPPAARAGSGSRRRVLVVDDEPLVGAAIARLLSPDHDVEVLTSAAEVARRADEGARWDVVLCDLVMPEVTGMELARRLERTAPDLARRLVFITGGAYTEASRAFLAANGRRWLEKPLDPELLRELVRTAGPGR